MRASSSIPTDQVQPMPPADAGVMRSVILVSIALIVITLVVYWQVEDNEFISLD
jgi:hypothetical protein